MLSKNTKNLHVSSLAGEMIEAAIKNKQIQMQNMDVLMSLKRMGRLTRTQEDRVDYIVKAMGDGLINLV